MTTNSDSENGNPTAQAAQDEAGQVADKAQDAAREVTDTAQQEARQVAGRGHRAHQVSRCFSAG